jgi:hypothetical protein
MAKSGGAGSPGGFSASTALGNMKGLSKGFPKGMPKGMPKGFGFGGGDSETNSSDMIEYLGGMSINAISDIMSDSSSLFE